MNNKQERIVRSFATGWKMFYLNGFNIQRFVHHYCLCVIFLGMCCHLLNREAEWLKSLDSRFAVLMQILLRVLKNSLF